MDLPPFETPCESPPSRSESIDPSFDAVPEAEEPLFRPLPYGISSMRSDLRLLLFLRGGSSSPQEAAPFFLLLPLLLPPLLPREVLLLPPLSAALDLPFALFREPLAPARNLTANIAKAGNKKNTISTMHANF